MTFNLEMPAITYIINVKETRFQKLSLEVIGLLPFIQAFAYLDEKCWSPSGLKC